MTPALEEQSSLTIICDTRQEVWKGSDQAEQKMCYSRIEGQPSERPFPEDAQEWMLKQQ